MNKYLANITSYLFHPSIIPTVVYVILLYFFSESIITIQHEAKFQLIVLLFLMTFIIPVLSTITLLKSNIISGLELNSSKERVYPFFLTSIFYSIVCYFFYKYFNFSILFYIIFLINLSLILALIITYFWKISLHSIAMGGLVGFSFLFCFFSGDSGYLYFFVSVVILSGVVMTARLALLTHNIWQVFAGFLLGLIVSLSLYLFI